MAMDQILRFNFCLLKGSGPHHRSITIHQKIKKGSRGCLCGNGERLGRHFFCGGTSVHEPCATSAAMPMLSPSVGCGWMVLPMSTLSAPDRKSTRLNSSHHSI